MYGPTVPFSEEIHANKYRGPGETFRDSCSRIASALQDNDAHYHAFRDIQLNMRFMAAGRVQAAMGSIREVTPYNCFVSGVIEDSFVDDEGHIMQRATEAARTMRLGGGIGYDFSTLRPRGDMIKTLQSRSTGPVSFMDIYDAVCRCIASSGHRRGAQMGVLRIDHPDIEEFINAKQNSDQLTGFNISIAVTDEFMNCLRTGKPFKLEWGGQVYREVNAEALWEQIMRSTYDWAEPGVLFIDTINRMNNLWYCEKIAATNPCGEQPLPPFGACLLGSFNLTKYLKQTPAGYEIDYDQLGADIPHVVRAMDNVVDRAKFPMDEQKEEALNKRRMGLGATGVANALEACGYPYGSTGFLEMQDKVLGFINEQCYWASVELAKEKGPFPLFDAGKYCHSWFIRTLSPELQEAIHTYGIRNSHLTSIAPTGTISLSMDNVSSGIEPVFAYSFDRTVHKDHNVSVETVEDYGYSVLNTKGRKTADVTVAQHLNVLSLAQRHVDSAVSKTCNVPSDISWEDFKMVYVTAWENGCKGITTFRSGGKRGGILVAKEDDTADEQEDVIGVASEPEEPATACYLDPVTGRRECA